MSFPAELAQWLRSPTDNLATLISSAIVFLGLGVAALQWNLASRSGRYQQFADRVRDFYTPHTKAAIKMLLNFERDIDLLPDTPPVRVSWELIGLALIPGTHRQYLYEPVLIAIRDRFNDLLQNLSRLAYLAQHDLVHWADVDHIVKPLILRIAADRKFQETRFARNLRLYIQWRGSEGVIVLFKRYDVDIRDRKATDKASLENDITTGFYGECRSSDWGAL
jgi:hypothetical protein